MDVDINHDNNGGDRGGIPVTSALRRKSSGYMSEDEQRERRASIQSIMNDGGLSAMEKRKSIQSLMDGRRRSSDAGSNPDVNQSSMAAAAAAAAAYYDSSDNDDYPMSDTGTFDDVSVASTISSSGDPAGDGQQALTSSPLQSLQQRVVRSLSLRNFKDSDIQAAAAAAASALPQHDPLNPSRRMEKARPECNHYERMCTLISPCCGLAFGCRICHDECPNLPPPTALQAEATVTTAWSESMDSVNTSKRRRSLPIAFEEEETHHQIDRFAIKEVICRQCFTRQSSKTNTCINCGTQFGAYHCSICNLWMSADESPYHCNDCGFCRVGGRENFKHCHDCGMCIDAQLFDDHNCKAGKYMSNCPVCQEDLFSSRYASHEMPCGHAIHWHCFKELTSYDTRCPVCKKTAESPEQMAPTWSAMAMGIALQPVPVELARAVTIMCNDCEEREENRRWHFLGVQCSSCSSFNTTVERITLMGREAAAFLDDLDVARGVASGARDIPSDIDINMPESSLSHADDADMEDTPDVQDTSGSTGC